MGWAFSKLFLTEWWGKGGKDEPGASTECVCAGSSAWVAELLSFEALSQPSQGFIPRRLFSSRTPV